MKPYYKTEHGTIYHGSALDILKTLPDEFVNCCVTSPPYWGLRDYGIEGQLGLEKTPERYVLKMVQIFQQVKRVLRNDGTLWLNLGDSYSGSMKGALKDGWADRSNCKQGTNEGSLNIPPAKNLPGLKPKDLIGIPWRVAFALQADGWYLRSDIIWHKPNPMPESVTDRPTKAHEYLFK
jgi:DNA modification methylase